MRKSEGAVAIIRRFDSLSRPLFLAQWNLHWQAYNFIAGHRHQTESYRQCVIREIAEELGLVVERDCSVSDKPLRHVEYQAWSEGAKAQTFYIMELFEAKLTDVSLEKVIANSMNRWLTWTEIVNGKCEDGKHVSSTMHLLIEKAAVA